MRRHAPLALALLITACTPQAVDTLKALGTELGLWAAEKSTRYGICMQRELDDDHQWTKTEARHCLGETFTPDRETPACDQVKGWMEKRED